MLPKQIKLASHDGAGPCPLPGEVVDNRVVLKAVGPALVATHAAADLRLADSILRFVQIASGGLEKIGFKRGHRFSVVGSPRPSRRPDALSPGGIMGDFAAVLVLVPVLPTLARPGKPANRKAVARHDNIAVSQNGNRDGAGVNAASPFSRRNPLDAMAASFIFKAGDIVGFYLSAAVKKVGAVLSALGLKEAQVSIRQVMREQLGIVAAFCGPDFDDLCHEARLT